MNMNSNERGSIRTLFLIIVGIIILYITVFSKDSRYLSEFSQLLPGRIYEVTKASENLPISRDPSETITISEVTKLRKMLQEEKFEQLNIILGKYQSIFEKDQSDEYKVYDAYGAFYVTVPSYEDFFKKWIDITPDKYQPYLAITQYYYAKAWESRGYKWSKDTSKKQFKSMRFFFEKAKSNLDIALLLNPNLMVAYNTLIGIYNATGDNGSENEFISITAELFPYSFIMRSTCSWVKQPRWGGSYILMEDIARDAEQYSDKNPKLPVLYGFIYYDQAKIFERDDKYEKALEMLDKALAFGDDWSFYNERARIYLYDLKQYDQALREINRSIELRPVRTEHYLTRSRIYFAQGNYKESLADVHMAETITPGTADARTVRKWASATLLKRGHTAYRTDLRNAIKEYDLSLTFDDNNADTYYWRGMARGRLKEYDAAEADFKTAIRINPRHFDSYRMLDYVLARKRRWDTIISYWDAFLKLEPTHADAYYERAGTYYHKKDMKHMMCDLKKACEFGNENACKRYQTAVNGNKPKG